MHQHDECTQGRSADAALYDRYAASIFGYARLYTPSWEDAEDVTLEVFTAALEQGSLSSLSEQQQFAWLRRVAHNKLVDRYRRSVAIDFVDMQHGWTTDGMILYRTSNGGQQWTKLSPGASFKQVTSLDFVSSTLGWAISGQGKNSSLLLKTTDGGQTWALIPFAIS